MIVTPSIPSNPPPFHPGTSKRKINSAVSLPGLLADAGHCWLGTYTVGKISMHLSMQLASEHLPPIVMKRGDPARQVPTSLTLRILT
jgi:hypothetical protein